MNVVDVHTQFTASLNFAVFASVNWHTKVKSQVSQSILVILRYQGVKTPSENRKLDEETLVSRKVYLYKVSRFSWVCQFELELQLWQKTNFLWHRSLHQIHFAPLLRSLYHVLTSKCNLQTTSKRRNKNGYD